MTFLLAAGGAALGYAGVGGLTMATGGMLGLGLGSALGTSKAAGQAAQTQADAARESGALQKQMFEQQMKLQDPYRQAGLIGQNQLMTLLGLSGAQPSGGGGGGFLGGVSDAAAGAMAGPYVGGDVSSPDYGKYAKDFSMADYKADPGYAFRLSEGMKALSHKAGSRGGLVSGTTMKGMADYIGGSASQEYGNAFARYQAERAARLQPLGNLMSTGQAAASNQAAGAGNYATNAGNAITGAGAASAAGTLGAANTLANTLGATASAYQNQSNFNNWLAQNKIPAVSQPTYMTPQNMNFDPYSGVRQSTTGYI
jgi:hypothetical protein